jgi:hypothetical protein
MSRALARLASDGELAARQSALRDEASALLTELDRSGIFTDLGPLTVTGSYVSELMYWREVDVMVLVGADFSPQDVMQLMSRIVRFPGVVGFAFRDERPSYPDQISGLDIYTAVVEDGIRTPEQFRSWLAERGMPDA